MEKENPNARNAKAGRWSSKSVHFKRKPLKKAEGKIERMSNGELGNW
jgi:hypothetical protein